MKRSVLSVTYALAFNNVTGEWSEKIIYVGLELLFSDNTSHTCVNIVRDEDGYEFIATFTEGYSIISTDNKIYEEKP